MGSESGLQSVPEVDTNILFHVWADICVLVPDDPFSDVATAADDCVDLQALYQHLAQNMFVIQLKAWCARNCHIGRLGMCLP